MKVLLEQRGHIRRDEERRALAADLEVQQWETTKEKCYFYMLEPKARLFNLDIQICLQ